MKTISTSALCTFFLFQIPTVMANTYRCKAPNGSVTISSQPCAGNYVTTGVVSAESPSASSLQRAYSDLERQKKFIETRESENRTQYRNSYSATESPRDKLNSCLMQVAAKRHYSSYSEAQSKIGCYRGLEFRDECEMSVTATSGLTTGQEQSLRQMCR